MDVILEDHLLRVESALHTLLDSITSYNPSPTAAGELLTADEGLSKRLRDLATHQSNYMRIQELKEQGSSLERHIRESVAGLAGVREELLAVGSKGDDGVLAGIEVDDSGRESAEQAEIRPVPLSELLGYASRISRFTVPPAKQEERHYVRLKGLPEDTSKRNIKEGENINRGILPDDYAGRRISPDGSLEATAAGKPPKAMISKLEGSTSSPVPGGHMGVGIAALTEPERDWQLQKPAALPFVPWPNDEMIRIGGLARVQSLIEKGKEVEGWDGSGRDDEEGDSVVVHSRSDEKEDLRRRESIDTNEYGSRVISRESRQKQDSTQRPAVFGGLDLYDPDEP